MEEDPSSVTEKRRTLRTVRWLIILIALATAAAWFLTPPAASEERTLFLHPDGQLSLGCRKAARFSPSEIAHWPQAELQAGYQHFVLDAPPETLLPAWNPTLEQLAALGYPYYQLRVGRDTMNFHIPMGGSAFHQAPTREPNWIDLRRDGGEKLELREPFDVVVLADNSTTCGKLLDTTPPYQISGTSLLVDCEGSAFLRSKTEDQAHQPPKQSLAARVRNLFRP